MVVGIFDGWYDLSNVCRNILEILPGWVGVGAGERWMVILIE